MPKPFQFDTSDPEGKTAPQQGMERGASIGSMFGPTGAVIGTFIGAAAGFAKGSGERMRAKRKATRQSYQFGQDVFNYARETRENIETQFERDVSLLTARSAASGGVAIDSLNLQKGKLVQERDVALGNLNEEVQTFRESESYKWLKKDYRLTTGVDPGRKSLGRGEFTYNYQVGQEGRTHQVAFTPEMRKKMQTMKGNPNRYEIELFEAYADRIRPSLGQYEKFVFGDKVDREAYVSNLNQRIDEANIWYKKQQEVLKAEAILRKEQGKIEDNRGPR